MTFDTNREGLAVLYTPQSMLTFEGEQFMGAESILAKLGTLTFSVIRHTITTLDCQPSSVPGGIVVFVCGTLQMDQDAPFKFSQVFHLNQAAGGQYFCHNDLFRLNIG